MRNTFVTAMLTLVPQTITSQKSGQGKKARREKFRVRRRVRRRSPLPLGK